MLVSFGLLMVCAEIYMYVSIYTFLILHNKQMKLVLPENVVKSRIKKNVIDLSAHVINFVVEITVLVLVGLGSYWITTDFKFLLRCFSTSTYGILGAFHICHSPILRREFKDTLKSLFKVTRMIISTIKKKMFVNLM